MTRRAELRLGSALIAAGLLLAVPVAFAVWGSGR